MRLVRSQRRQPNIDELWQQRGLQNRRSRVRSAPSVPSRSSAGDAPASSVTGAEVVEAQGRGPCREGCEFLRSPQFAGAAQWTCSGFVSRLARVRFPPPAPVPGVSGLVLLRVRRPASHAGEVGFESHTRHQWREWRNGGRTALRTRRPTRRAGSTPVSRTNICPRSGMADAPGREPGADEACEFKSRRGHQFTEGAGVGSPTGPENQGIAQAIIVRCGSPSASIEERAIGQRAERAC
jgi:hypothetical protein